MARVRKLSKGTQDVRPHLSEVHCYYQSVEGSGGERLLHLTTFGSTERMSVPKSSQSIQLDREAAAALVAVIRSTFPGL